MHSITLLAIAVDERGFGGTAGPDLTRYLLVVGLLIAAILGFAFVLPRFMRGAHRHRAARRNLAVIDVLPLGGKRQLSLVRCYDRTFALGLGERDVTLVAELDPAQAEIEATGEAEPEQEFLRLFDVARQRLGAKLPERRKPAVEHAVSQQSAARADRTAETTAGATP